VIASVRGPVQGVRTDSVVVEVGGVGLLVQVTPTLAATLRRGQEAALATSLVVREDALTLYGFADPDERDVFELVQTVSGIGPRLALAMLAVHSPDGLRAAVAAEDLTALTKVPGIGRKGAARLVLELSGKLGQPAGIRAAAPPAPDAAEQLRSQVTEALVGLGWPARTAAETVEEILAERAQADGAGSAGGADSPTSGGGNPAAARGGNVDGEVAAVLRAALRRLGRHG